jgi:poly-beta-1,6-N-acetyl-D-glucosamine synthase
MKKNANFISILFYIILYIITFLIIISIFILHPIENNIMPWFRYLVISFATILLIKYFIYMTVSPWYEVWNKWKYEHIYKKELYKYKPKVSIMVPAWNEEVGLLNTVKSLLKSTYKNTEIVVINDGSEDKSHQLMVDFLKKYEIEKRNSTNNMINVIYHYKKNGGKGSALNTAIKISKGSILISIDADCYVEENAIANIVKYFIDPNVMAVVGNVKIGNTEKIIGVIQYLEFLFSFYFKKAESLFNSIYIIGGAAGAFRREIFHKFGGYNTKNITEDIELSMRIQDAGMKIVYASDAIVYTEGASSIKGLQKQRLRWKRGRFQTFIELKHMFFSFKKHHNKILTFIILPIAIFGEVQLSLEPLFLFFLYIYSYLIDDYSSFISGIIVVSFMFFIQIFFDKNKNRYSLYLLAPIGWLLFYLSTYVEYTSLIGSIWGHFKKKDIVWQKWQRKGINN